MLMHPEIFGALGDGVHDDGPAIQEAINACCACGGGEVLLTGGRTYVSRFLILRSCVDLRLEKDAELKARPGHLFCPDRPPHEPGEEEEELDTGKPARVFLYALACHGLHVLGQGRIRGAEDGLADAALLYMDQCSDVDVRGLELTGDGNVLCLGGCSRVLAEGLSLQSRFGSGIVLDHTRDVKICGCRIRSAGPGIRVRDTRAHGSASASGNISVEDCSLCAGEA